MNKILLVAEPVLDEHDISCRARSAVLIEGERDFRILADVVSAVALLKRRARIWQRPTATSASIK
jgi:hypothetical protein